MNVIAKVKVISLDRVTLTEGENLKVRIRSWSPSIGTNYSIKMFTDITIQVPLYGDPIITINNKNIEIPKKKQAVMRSK
jgi:hypothetical protein